jgi:hypothetical protein
MYTTKMKNKLLIFVILLVMCGCADAICDPLGGTCDNASCSDIFTNVSDPWVNYASRFCRSGDHERLYILTDDCVGWPSGWDNYTSYCVQVYKDTFSGPGYSIVCPDAEFLGRTVVETDCWNDDTSDWCTGSEPPLSLIDFTDTLFLGPTTTTTTTTSTTTTTLAPTTTTIVQSGGGGSGFFPSAVVSASPTVTVAAIPQITGNATASQQDSNNVVTIVAVVLLSFAVIKKMK